MGKSLSFMIRDFIGKGQKQIGKDIRVKLQTTTSQGMEINRLIIWSIVFLWSVSCCMANNQTELLMLKPKDLQITEVLELIIKDESEYGNIEISTILFKIEKLEIGYEIRIGTLYTESISSYLAGRKDKPLGYFEYEGVTVIVFGEEEKLLFDKTNKMKSFDFLKTKPELKDNKVEIPPPPVIYEPVIWVYTYEHGKLKQKDKGRFSLLK